MFTRLLVPVDGSPHSNRAVDVAVELAKCHSSSVVLVHVIRDLSLPREILEMITAGEITAGRLQILQDSADMILGRALDKFVQATIANVSKECLMGDPASKILECAERNGADCIVLGQRGLHPHGSMMGGVTAKILSRTQVSCLVVS